MNKNYRIYFNRDPGERVLHWVIDSGDRSTEIRVSDVYILVPCLTQFSPNPKDSCEPKAWLEVRGRLTIFDKAARIE